MKKIKRSKFYTFWFPKLILFKEDIEKIIDIFSDNFDKIEIQIGEFMIDSKNDLDQFENEYVDYFEIIGYGNINNHFEKRMGFIVAKTKSWLSINNYPDDLKCLYVETQIKDNLEKRKRLLNVLDSTILKYNKMNVIIFILYLIMLFINYKYLSISTMFVTLLFLILFLLILAPPLLYPTIINKIYLKYSSQMNNFFQRNKDNLIVAIISAIIGSALGGLIVYLITSRR